MYGGKDTLYEVLGVNRSASPGDIVRAYRTKRAQLLVGTTTTEDQQHANLVHEAYEVLSDPQKRAAYDASLRDKGFLRPEVVARRKVPKYAIAGGAAAAVLVIALLAYWRWNAGPDASIPQEIVASVATAVGRLERLDMQGKATPLGHAFAIDQGVMVSTCPSSVANTQLVVAFGPRRAAVARVDQPDKSRNVCKLAVVGAGSWPLTISREEPKVGAKVFAAVINANGEAAIVDGKVKSLIPAEGGRAIEFSVPVTPAMSGAPLIDVYGRVVGIMATQHAYGSRNVALPAPWVAGLR
jgi:hypothetical protein